MSTELQTIPQEKIKPVLALIEQSLPVMIQGRDKAVAAMKGITAVESDEDVEKANGLLVRVRSTFDKVQGLRTEITKPLDELKEMLMVYEKDISTDAKAKNDYNRIRQMIGDYQQKKLDEQKKKDAEAARNKAVELAKVNMRQVMQNNFNKVFNELSINIDKYAREHFNTSTVETWDAAVASFSKIVPKLKMDLYEKCFILQNTGLTPEEQVEFGRQLVAEISYESQNEEYKKIAMPILADWKARIPELKAEKIKIEAAGEEERARLEKEKKQREEKEASDKQAELDRQQKQKDDEAQQQANLDTMQAEFVEQAVNQTAEDTGPVKKVLKFNDPKKVPKALSEIIYHCFLKKFEVQKKDRDKNWVFDSKGRPEYVDEVQKWINYFQKNCDAFIDGTEIFDDSKVIIRK